MPTELKAQTIDSLAQKLRDSKGAVLLDYRGLTVAAITQLRRDLVSQNVEFTVAKNTLLRLAAQRAEVDITADLLTGPTAVAFGWDDEVAPAKALTDFARRSRGLVEVKGGVIGGRSFTARDIERVAELPSRDTLLAQLLGTLQSPMSMTLGLLQAPARQVAGLAQALNDKRQESEAAA
jgi:large subunit ribosomal protein L10